MSYMLFMDESGHDHKQLPYEVRGGICLRDDKAWQFTREMKELESRCFGFRPVRDPSELKAGSLLAKKRFRWAAQREPFTGKERRRLVQQFLARTARKEAATSEQF